MLFLFRFLSHWPLPLLHAAGGMLGWLVWILSPTYRTRFRANVAQAGLPFDTARPAIAEAGRFVSELPKLWMRPHHQSCLDNVKVEGRFHADAALAGGRGVIFFGAHGGSFELGLQALAELFGPATGMYRPARQAWLARLMYASRHRPGLIMAPASLSGVRQMHKALQANQVVALLTDQVPPDGLGLWAPFFGKPAYTMTLAARLALKNSAPMLPVSCERLARGQGYVLKIWPPLSGLQASPPPALLEAATLINQAVEAIVLEHPGQYFWAYSRYKTPRQSSPAESSH